MVFLFLISLLTSPSVAQPHLKAAEVCTEVGRHIAKNGESSDWVKLNSPDLMDRANLFYWQINDQREARFAKTVEGLKQLKVGPKSKAEAAAIIEKVIDLKASQLDKRLYVPLALKVGAIEAYRIADYNFVRFGSNAYGSFLLKTQWVELLSDLSYTRALNQLVVKLLKDLNAGKVPSGDFQTDLESEFLALGFKKDEAQKRAWLVLGLYGSQGAFMSVFTRGFAHLGFEELKLHDAIHFLEVAVSYIDTLKPKGQLYSLPPQVRTDCKIGKPYHFWLAAYLAYRLKDEGYSSKKSAGASVYLGKLYEAFSQTNGRLKDIPLKDEDLFSPIRNSKRLGLSLKAAGATYGAKWTLGNKVSLNLDDILQAGLDHSKPSRSSSQAAKKYPRYYFTVWSNFDRVHGADEIFEKAFQ